MPGGAKSAAPDPYRTLFLKHVENALQKTPDAESLVELLQAATADFEPEKVTDAAARKTAFNELKLRLHPDKHGNDSKSNELFKKLQPFLKKAEAAVKQHGPPPMKKAKHTSAPGQKSSLPASFNAFTHWPSLSVKTDAPVGTTSWSGAPSLLATTGVHLRGQIAHGRGADFAPSGHGTWSNPWTGELKTLEDGDVDAIKQEITTGGPVVSTSFTPSAQFLQKYGAVGTAGTPVPVLLCGWSETHFGTAWAIKVRANPTYCPYTMQFRAGDPPAIIDAEIATGQCNCEQSISFVPQSALVDLKWLQDVEYVGVLSSVGKGFLDKPNGGVLLSGLSLESGNLPDLLRAFAAASGSTGDILEAVRSGKTIEVHEPNKRSASRTVTLQNLKHDSKTNTWSVGLIRYSPAGGAGGCHSGW